MNSNLIPETQQSKVDIEIFKRFNLQKFDWKAVRDVQTKKFWNFDFQQS